MNSKSNRNSRRNSCRNSAVTGIGMEIVIVIAIASKVKVRVEVYSISSWSKNYTESNMKRESSSNSSSNINSTSHQHTNTSSNVNSMDKCSAYNSKQHTLYQPHLSLKRHCALPDLCPGSLKLLAAARGLSKAPLPLMRSKIVGSGFEGQGSSYLHLAVGPLYYMGQEFRQKAKSSTCQVHVGNKLLAWRIFESAMRAAAK